MRKMLRFREHYALEYNVMFKSDKTKCIFLPNKGCAGRLHTQRPVFYINNSAVEYVEQWPHLGHVISSDLDDKHDINRGRSALVSQINNVLCFFRTLDSITKMRLLISYCYSLYTGALSEISPMLMSSESVAHGELVCVAFWGLPLNTQCVDTFDL